MAKEEKEVLVPKSGISFSRARYHLLCGNSKDRRLAYHEIKKELLFPDLCDAVDYLSKNLNSKRQELIWGKPLPKSYAELGEISETPYLSDNIHSELNINLIAIRKHKYEINLFITYKDDYEKNLIIGNYTEAEKYLGKIETEICYSLWTLENRFLLKELSGFAPENKELLSQFNLENKSMTVTKSLAHYLSLRAERSLSVNRYFGDLEFNLHGINNSKNKEAFINYYRFKLTFLSHINFTKYAEILSIDFEHSIVDRYLNLTRVLTSLLAVSNYLDDGSKKNSVIENYLINRINYLIRKINDPILYKLKLFSGDSLFPAFDIAKSYHEIKVIDKYTLGLYSEAENELIPLLLEKPMQFDLYVLYIKSLVYQKKPFSPVGNPKSVQNEILLEIYKITSVNINPDQAAMNLLRLANNLSSSILSYGITDFVFYQTEGKKERTLLSRLSYNVSNPIIHEVYPDKSDQENYLALLAEKYSDSITIKFFRERLKGLDNLLLFEKQIPEGKFKLEYAKKLQEQQNYIGAAKEWEHLINKYFDTPPILETSIVNLFKCYEQLDRIDDCIHLFVKSYFLNNFIIEKIETKNVLKKISSNRFKNVSKNLDLPIFYTIVDSDEIEAHIAFEGFNKNNGVERPSSLIEKFEYFDKDRMLYFFKYSCGAKMLMHSTYILNSKDRLEERLAIIQFVKGHEPDNKQIEAEIKSIQNTLIIQQGLIDLDESKIYVNEQGIIENELQDYEAIYQRYQLISGIAAKNKVLLLEGGKLTTYVSGESTELEKIEYSSNPVFEIYHELFEAVKDKFLNSQFGIVAYLSTRIRHGVLVGELRPIFEKHNLITLKEGNGSTYRRNFYWDLMYEGYSSPVQEQIQTLLNVFSSQVDGLIFDLIKKYLQVYHPEKNSDGWFNYQFDDSELWYDSILSVISGKSKNFTEFVEEIFNILWIRTDSNLENIRKKIETDIMNQFNTYFNDLERQITQVLGESGGEHLVKAIRDCSTEIQTVIQKISRWFKRSEVKALDFELSNLINTILEYTNKSSPYKKLNVKLELTFDYQIKGEFKMHFADLLRIFLENILNHSAEHANEIPCSIITSNGSENELRITIENKITDKSKLDILKEVWKGGEFDTEKLVSEHKSGYHKAYKILSSDLKSDKEKCLKTNISDLEDHYSVNLLINTKNILV